jgi:hypothetical protein
LPSQVAEVYRTDRKKFDATAKDYVKKVSGEVARSSDLVDPLTLGGLVHGRHQYASA